MFINKVLEFGKKISVDFVFSTSLNIEQQIDLFIYF